MKDLKEAGSQRICPIVRNGHENGLLPELLLLVLFIGGKPQEPIRGVAQTEHVISSQEEIVSGHALFGDGFAAKLLLTILLISRLLRSFHDRGELA